MKQGRTLTELAQEIERQNASKHDYKATTGAMTMAFETGKGLKLELKGHGAFDVTEHTHNQIGERIGIPAKYYDRMRTEAPALLSANVNHWFHQAPERRLLRTMTQDRPIARAFLSDRYRPLDNFDLAMAVLPEMVNSHNQLQIVSSEITERKLYIKWTTPRVIGEVKKGDPVQAGGVITNSEIGLGALSVLPFITRLVCTNGMTAEEFGQKRYHTGRASQSEQDAYELYTDDTLRKDDIAFWAKVKDTVKAVMEQSRFDQILQRMREATEQKIEGDVTEVVEIAASRFSLNQDEKKGVLRHLIEDGVGLNAYGLMNAITSVAGEVESYDRASDLERVAGNVLTLAPTDWKVLSRGKAA